MKVILLVIDTLRFDVFHRLNFMSKLSEDSRTLYFENAFSTGTSTPFAFPGILASEYSFVEKQEGILKAPISLAEVFQRKNFYTWGNAGGNVHLSNIKGFARGFKSYQPVIYYDSVKKKSRIKLFLKKFHIIRKTWSRICYFKDELRKLLKTMRNELFIYPAEKILNEMIEVLQAYQRVFAFSDIMEVHGPYIGVLRKNLLERLKLMKLVKIKYLSTDQNELESWRDFYVNVYKEAAQLVDKYLENFFNILDAKGILGDTMIVITSDHGEEFLEHGGFDHRPKPFDEIIHTPLLVFVGWERFSKDEKNVARNKLISMIDIPQSIVSYLFKIEQKGFMGKNTMFGDVERDYVYSEGWRASGKPYHDPKKRGRHNYSFRTKDWKYIVLEGRECFFDLRKDPFETHCLIIPDSIRSLINEFQKELKRAELKQKLFIKR